jgi:CBS domain-containing protein
MKRYLHVHRTLTGDPQQLSETLRTQVRALLRQATGADSPPIPGPDGSFHLRVEGDVAGVVGGKTVRVFTGVATRRENRLCVPLQWHAEPARQAFPAFDGALELEPLSESLADLTLTGSYSVPLGPIGGLIDASLLRGVAEDTATRLVEGLTGAIVAAADVPLREEPPPKPGAQMRVQDVMTPDPVLFEEDLPVRTAALLLFHYQISGAPVINAQGGLIGVLSERDLLEKEAAPRFGFGRSIEESERRRTARTVGEACSMPAYVTSPDTRLHDAAREMLERGVSRLVVVDESRVAGIVTRHDVLRALLRNDAELQAAVDATLATLAEPDVRARVEWGTVTVSGEVERRSSLAPLLSALESLDGVIAVDGALHWRTDDLVPPLGYPIV